MKETQRAGFAERMKTAAEARKTQLANFRPKATVVAPIPADRVAERAAELARVRQARSDAKVARKQAADEAAIAVREAEDAASAAALDAKRGERKERKALTKAEAKAKRDARYAARKARN